MKKKKIPPQAKIYIGILMGIAVLLLLWSITNLKPQGILTPAFFVFLVLAIVLELTAVEISEYGFVSLSFSIYFAMLIKYDFPPVVAIAAIAIAARELLVNKQPVFYRLGDFATSLINITLSGIIFSVINRGSPFLSQANIIGMIAGGIAYYGFDHLLASTVTGLLHEDVKRGFDTVRSKIIFFNISLAPMGALLIVAFDKNPWFMALILIPLYALRKSFQYGINEIAIANQKELESAIKELKHDYSASKERIKDLTTELSKRVEELSILFEMGQSLGTSVNMESTMEIIVSMIRKLVLYQSCVIFLVQKGTLVAAKSVTPYRDILEYSSLLKLEESIVNMVVQSKKPILITDMQSMSEQRIFKDEKSLVCIPLVVKNDIIGVIYVGAIRPGTYNEDHLHLLSILGNAASNAIKTALLYEELAENYKNQQNLNEKLDGKVHQSFALLDLGQDLGSSLNLAETLRIITRGMESMFNYQSGAIFLIRKTRDGEVFVPMKTISPYEAQFENLNLSSRDVGNILGWTAHHKRGLLLTDTRETPLTTIVKDELSVMAVPLIVENLVIGAIYLGHSRDHFFNEEALELFRSVAYLSAMTIRNAELYERTATMAITDGLTGLYTHRYFQERLTEEIKAATRYKGQLALVMVDADKFKQYNDTLGHPEGDKVLKEISALLKTYTRESDLVCRIGGDEFTILLKQVDKKNAIQKAEAIRKAVESRFRERAVQVTSSIGLACFPDDAGDKKELIKAADDNLYVSKKNGRNQVTWTKSKPKPQKPAASGQTTLLKNNNPG